MEQKTDLKIKELAFVVPDDVRFEKDIVELTDVQLQRWHDLMHVFFEKLLDGLGQYSNEFKWSFNKVIIKHREIINEMTKRNIFHYTPFNNLDVIKLPDSNITVIEEEKVTSELSKEKSEGPLDLSFSSPIQIKKEDKVD